MGPWASFVSWKYAAFSDCFVSFRFWKSWKSVGFWAAFVRLNPKSRWACVLWLCHFSVQRWFWCWLHMCWEAYGLPWVTQKRVGSEPRICTQQSWAGKFPGVSWACWTCLSPVFDLVFFIFPFVNPYKSTHLAKLYTGNMFWYVLHFRISLPVRWGLLDSMSAVPPPPPPSPPPPLPDLNCKRSIAVFPAGPNSKPRIRVSNSVRRT